MEIETIFQNENFVVVNKPAGVLVHGIFDKYGPKHNEETLVDWLLKEYSQVATVGDMPLHDSSAGSFPFRPGIVHRLDRETSGAMVIALNNEYFSYLKSLFQERKVEKKYWALVWGWPKDRSGVIDKPISIRNGTVKRTVFKGKMPREAVTEYSVVKYFVDESGEKFALVEASPKTGRTHQIRVHFSAIGHSLVGDKLYGKKASIASLDRHFLHAHSLSFTDKDGGKHEFVAPLSADLEGVLSLLKEDPGQSEG